MCRLLLSALGVHSPPLEDDIHTQQLANQSSSISSHSAVMPGSWPAFPTTNSGALAGANNVNANNSTFTDVGRDLNMQVKIIKGNGPSPLEKLPRARCAGYDSSNHQTCMGGTRVGELKCIEKWEADRTQKVVFLLRGVAGSGKSTIAKTFAERSAKRTQRLSFFCSRDDPDRRNVRLIFPTLAYYLAHKSESFNTALSQTINSKPEAGYETLDIQFENYIVHPLKSSRKEATIIIDALDECEDDEPYSAILSLIASYIDKISFLKFFITSRPEKPIRFGLRLLELHTEILLLHEVEPTSVDHDIELYIQTNLLELAKRNRWDSWPTVEAVTAVTKACAGLFIVASVLIKTTVSHPDPKKKLYSLIDRLNSTIHGTMSRLDNMYGQVLAHSLDKFDEDDKNYYLNQLQLVVRSIVLASHPLPHATIATILNIQVDDVRTALTSLHSIFVVPDDDLLVKPIRVCHKSLVDYLTDKGQCDPRFYINPSIHHLELGICCLWLMTTSLKQNICGLPRYAMNADLNGTLERYIGNGLKYACISWAKHVRLASGDGDDVGRVIENLNDFFRCNLLQWLEVLSMVDDLSCAVYSLRDVIVWLVNHGSNDPDLLAVVRDSERFVLRFFDVIQSSAPHIYASALPFCPSSSRVQQLYQAQMLTDVKVFGAVDDSWDACTRTIRLRHIISLIAFSHRDDLIAVGQPRLVEIFETATGQRRATLTSNNYPLSLAFGPDNTVLVAGCRNGRVDVWDLQTGSHVNSLEGHTQEVFSVTFSPSGTMFASSSNDHTIRIWNIDPLDCRLVLTGHSDHVQSICWSSTGHEIISGSIDTKIKVWSVPGETCSKTFSIHASYVRSVASSPDSSMIASGSEDGTIKVLNTDTGVVHHTALVNQEAVESIRFLDRDRIMYATSAGTFVIRDFIQRDDVLTFKYEGLSPAISFDGTRLASISRNVVKIWQTDGADNNRALSGNHTARVNCVSFSRDGRLVASGSDDRTVKVWDIPQRRCLTTFYSHFGGVRCVTISPNSKFGASHATDDAIRVWEVRTDSQVATFGENGIAGIHDICFSPDDSRLAWTIVRMSSLVVELWEVESGERLASMEVKSYENIGGDSMSFDFDGTSIILRDADKTYRWRLSSARTHGHESESLNDDTSHPLSLPMVFVPIQDTALSISSDAKSDVSPDQKSPWILDKHERRVLWIPPDLKQKSYSNGKNIVFTTDSGRVIIVDFSDVIS